MAQPSRPILRATLVAATTVVVVTIVGFLVRAGGLFEMPLSEALNTHHHGLIGLFGNALYLGIGPVPAIVGTFLVTVAILIVTRSIPRASTFAVTVGVTWLSVAVDKLLVHRTRPDAALLPFPYHPIQIDASYPSGHAAFIAALAVTAFLMARSLRTQIAAAAIGSVAVVGTGITLAIDAVHYPTDVIASAVWALGVAPLVYLVWTRVVLPRATTILGRRAATHNVSVEDTVR